MSSGESLTDLLFSPVFVFKMAIALFTYWWMIVCVD